MEPTAQPWRRNLWLIWAALFVMNSGFSLIVPFLPLYVQGMGLGSHVELWTGVIFSANYIAAALSVPFWGRVADRYGRRPMMIRSAFGMGIVVCLMGLVSHPWQLVVLRALQGLSVGFMPAAIAYLTAITPKERTGYMLGMLQTSVTAGTILGPFVGGSLASFMGYKSIFFVTGFSSILSGVIVLLFIREKFTPSSSERSANVAADLRTVLGNPTLLAMMLVVLVQNFSVMTAEPILSLFLHTLHVPMNLLSFMSGAIFSIVGVADVLAAPFLGRRGDTLGYKKVLMICLGGVAAAYFLQGAALNWWQLLTYRFIQGCFVGGVLASANSLISLNSQTEFQGRAFSVASSAQMVGNFLGPLVGGALASGLSYRAVFPVTGAICLANLLWVWRAVPRGQSADTPTAA